MTDMDKHAGNDVDSKSISIPQIEHDEIGSDESENGIIEAQNREAEQYAIEFLTTVMKLRGVRIDREKFLRAELHKRGQSQEVIATAVASSPAAAGVDMSLMDAIAFGAISFETRKSSALSFAAGLPGGFGMLATVPADITQFYIHAFRVMQKIAYVYGWQSFLEDAKDVDDETLGKMAAFLGVMMGVGGASNSVASFASQVARPALQKHITNKALTKTAWYPALKSALRIIGVKLTKDSLAKTVTKAVPVVGGVISGGMTFATLQAQSKRLMKHLREIPPPNVDAAEYLAKVWKTEDDAPSRSSAVVTSVSEGISEASGVVSKQAGSVLSGAGSVMKGAASGAGSSMRDVASGASGRIGSMLRRKRHSDGEQAPSDVGAVDPTSDLTS